MKMCPRRTGPKWQENLRNLNNEETQMTVDKTTGASSAKRQERWETLPWTKIKAQVFKLQTRIAKAEKENKKSKVKALQRLLTCSFYAKCLAIKRVTSSKGSKTAGVDGQLWRTPNQKMQAVETLKRRDYTALPLKRIYIPKKSGKMRPLSIPSMKDRAMQALWYAAILPIAENRADPNAYGFRPNRSAHDAIDQCFIVLSRGFSATWVLEGDIEACFDSLDQKWLVQNIPMDKIILKKFLKAGFVEKGERYSTETGAAQGGVISPTLTVMALSGLEGKIRGTTKRQRNKEKINMITYADDFVVTAENESLLREKVIPILKEALNEVGLKLSEKKTKITRIEEGFDFLGFNIRKYKNMKLLIKPSKANVTKFLREIKSIIKRGIALPTEILIHQLNQKLTGWVNYYRTVVSSKVFSNIDAEIFSALERWCLKRHARKGKWWIMRKYFTRVGNDRWRFHCITKDKEGNRTPLYLKKATMTPIRRHKKILSAANPFDMRFKKYFQERAQERKTRAYTTKDTGSAGLRIIQPYEGLSGMR
jgi:RNA-directed DNA polymerase